MSGRRVKCRFCEQFTTQKEAFKVVVKGKNEYYCNEEHYKEAIETKENRKKFLEMSCELFDYNVATDTYFLKELKEASLSLPIKTMRYYLEDNMIDLDVALAKDFKTLIFKVKYFFAIIKRGVAEYEKIRKIESNEKILTTNMEHYKYKFKPRRKKTTWVDIIKGGI